MAEDGPSARYKVSFPKLIERITLGRDDVVNL